MSYTEVGAQQMQPLPVYLFFSVLEISVPREITEGFFQWHEEALRIF